MIYIYPTETAYAIGCDATKTDLVDRVFQLKNRPKNKTLPIIVADIDMAHKYAHITKHAQLLIDQHWPGPLTLVLEAKPSDLAEGIILHDNSIALRVSSHPTATKLTKDIGKPIVSTSANASGQSTCYDIAVIHHHIDTQNIHIIDEGVLPTIKPSTIIDARSEPKIIRI